MWLEFKFILYHFFVNYFFTIFYVKNKQASVCFGQSLASLMCHGSVTQPIVEKALSRRVKSWLELLGHFRYWWFTSSKPRLTYKKIK